LGSAYTRDVRFGFQVLDENSGDEGNRNLHDISEEMTTPAWAQHCGGVRSNNRGVGVSGTSNPNEEGAATGTSRAQARDRDELISSNRAEGETLDDGRWAVDEVFGDNRNWNKLDRMIQPSTRARTLFVVGAIVPPLLVLNIILHCRSQVSHPPSLTCGPIAHSW